MTVREQMKALLGETETEGADDLSLKKMMPQLVLAMQSLGLDISDEEQIDAFLKMLRMLSTSKSQMVKTALKHWSGAKASKALRIAKKSV